MFIAALFTMAKTWKQPISPSTDDWFKMWEGNGNPLQFLAWEIPWTEAAVHGVAKESNMT